MFSVAVCACVESLLFCGLGAFLSPFEVVSKSGKILDLR